MSQSLLGGKPHDCLLACEPGLDSFETDNAESLPLTRFSNPLVQFEVIDPIYIGLKG